MRHRKTWQARHLTQTPDGMWKVGQVVLFEDKPAYITRIGGDGSIEADTTSIEGSYVGDDKLLHGHWNCDGSQTHKLKALDYANAYTVVELPPEWAARAKSYAITPGAHDDEVEEHPSFATVCVTRATGGNQRLFMSSFNHSHTIHVTVQRATRRRSLSRDWISGSNRLIEFMLSEAQWARLVAAVGDGGGVPVTLRYVGGERMPDAPQNREVERFHDDVQRAAKETASSLDEAIAAATELLAKPTATKADRHAILAKLQRAKRGIDDSMPWVVKQLDERLETVVADSKVEIEAYFQQTAKAMLLNQSTQTEKAPVILDVPTKKREIE